jgi:Holliday junction resolvase RusA-like endonuclease
MRAKLKCAVINFTIPAMPPSVNKMYVSSRKIGVRFKSKELIEWQRISAFYLKKVEIKKTLYCVEIEFCCSNWLNKDKTVKKKDVSNFIKAVEDALSLAIGLDDSYFWLVSARKVMSNRTETQIKMYELSC